MKRMLILPLCLLLLCGGCGKKSGAAADTPRFPVSVLHALLKGGYVCRSI